MDMWDEYDHEQDEYFKKHGMEHMRKQNPKDRMKFTIDITVFNVIIYLVLVFVF